MPNWNRAFRRGRKRWSWPDRCGMALDEYRCAAARSAASSATAHRRRPDTRRVSAWTRVWPHSERSGGCPTGIARSDAGGSVGVGPIVVGWRSMNTDALPPEVLHPPRLLTGDDLIRAGFPPGPGFGRILNAVEDAQLESRVQTREEALELARSLWDGAR